MGLSDNTYLFYVLVFTGMILIYFFITEREILYQKKVIQRLFTIGFIFGFVIFPFFVPIIE